MPSPPAWPTKPKPSDLELDKLHDHEIAKVWEAVRTGQEQVLAGCDSIRDIRRRLQDWPAPE